MAILTSARCCNGLQNTVAHLAIANGSAGSLQLDIVSHVFAGIDNSLAYL